MTEVQDIRLGMRTANFSRSEGLPPRYVSGVALGPDRPVELLTQPVIPPSHVDRSLIPIHHLHSYAGMASFSIVTRDRTIDLLCPDAHAVGAFGASI